MSDSNWAALSDRRKELRVGWIIGDQLSHSPFVREAALIGGGIGCARYLWVAKYVNGQPDRCMRYEVYRPWRTYDAVIFLKAMGPLAEDMASKLRRRGTVVAFDANVNHYDVRGHSYYLNMLPTKEQQADAISMTRNADGVIADSQYLEEKIAPYNKHVTWIPDCVDMRSVPEFTPWRYRKGRLPLLWSGQSLKLFELLAIEDVLREYSSHIELILVTNGVRDNSRWFDSTREGVDRMLNDIPHRFVDFKSIAQLWSIYATGGVVVSPRFLDNTYNYGHTEWKITLGMSCGRFTVCDAVPSYVTVSERANGEGIRICRSGSDWKKVLDQILSSNVDLGTEGRRARATVETYYSANVVAAQHLNFMHRLISGRASCAF